MVYVLKDNFITSMKLIVSSNILFVLLAIITYGLYFVFEALILKILISKCDPKYPLKSALSLSFMTKFFNGITPFSIGGQPFQIYELSKERIDIANSALIIVENFIVFQFTIVFLSICAFISNIFFKITPTGFLWNITIIGFIINVIVLLFVIFICIKINISIKIGNYIIDKLGKIHLIKNVENVKEKWYITCMDYYKGFKDILKNKKMMFKCLILNIVCMLFNFAIPFFILKAINISLNVNIILCIVLSTYIYIVGSYVPLPGGAGGVEYAYINFFKLVIKNIYVTPTLILWRFIYYYLPMIIGAVLFNIKTRERRN